MGFRSTASVPGCAIALALLTSLVGCLATEAEAPSQGEGFDDGTAGAGPTGPTPPGGAPGQPPIMCTPGAESTPGMAGDPCPQTGTTCAEVGGMAITHCLPDGTWDRSGCTCIGPSPGQCGNGVIDPGEQCDGANLGGQTCATLAPSTTGTVLCDPATCTLDTSQCAAGPTLPVSPGVPGCEVADTDGATHGGAAEVLAAMVPCGFSSCHTGNGKAGLVLQGVTDLREALVGATSCIAPNLPLVDGSGGDAALDNSWLWQKLVAPADSAGELVPNPAWGEPGNCGQTPGGHGGRMPLAGSAETVTEERLAPIRNWICAGAPGP